MDQVTLQLLISKIDNIEKKIDEIIPKQAKIDNKTENIEENIKLIFQKVEQKFEYSLKYSKDKVTEHEKRCKIESDVNIKKLSVVIASVSAVTSAIITVVIGVIR